MKYKIISRVSFYHLKLNCNKCNIKLKKLIPIVTIDYFVYLLTYFYTQLKYRAVVGSTGVVLA